MRPPTQVVEIAAEVCDAAQVSVIRVCLVEDQEDIRRGLAELISESEGFSSTGAYRTMERLLESLPALDADAMPHVALIDLGLPGMSGIEGIGWLRRDWPSISPLVLTVHDDDARIMDALCAGANGYLLKNTPLPRLLEAIGESAAGGSPMSPTVARRVVELFRKVRPPAKSEHELTPHELRILNMLVAGENYKTTAVKLKVSVNTISYHVRHIYEKLHVHSRTEAVAKALRSGMFR